MKYISISLLFASFFACNFTSNKTAVNPLLSLFSKTETKGDTAIFAAEGEGFKGVESQKLPNISDSLLTKMLTSSMMEELNFTGSGEYKAGAQYELDEKNIGCVVYTEDNWFKKISLLIYDKSADKFIGVTPLAQYYGGESGLMYGISWLFKSDKTAFLFRKDLDVSFRAGENDEEPTEQRWESNSLNRWDNNKFTVEPWKDSTNYCKKFVYTIQ